MLGASPRARNTQFQSMFGAFLEREIRSQDEFDKDGNLYLSVYFVCVKYLHF